MAKPKKSVFPKIVNIQNKRARFEYSLLDRFVAGLVLQGTEIKSIRMGKANLQDSHCRFDRNELWVAGLHIAPYAQGNIYNHAEMRPRKLLLNKRELNKLRKQKEQKGITIVPLRLFVNDKGLAKLEIALAQGKKLHDKRQTLKERDIAREADRESARYSS